MRTVDVQGFQVPAVGFGTWELRGQAAYDGARHALEVGYRHLDTAQMYANEEEIGRALRDSGVARDQVWLTTKLAPRNLAPGRVRRSSDDSLRGLQTDYVDLLLIHWPADGVALGETLAAMEELREAGKLRAVGVSNFTPTLVREALRHASIITNQVEYHPYLDQQHLVDQAVEHDLMLTAYSPLAQGKVLDDETLVEIGRAHGKSAAQVALRWLLQQPKVALIPRSSRREHRAANFDIFDFELSEEEMARIDALARNRHRRIIDPPGLAPDWER